jgi:LytS/YehU family sensor histidine kinase
LILKRPILTTGPNKTIQKDKISNFIYKNLYLTKNNKNSLQFSKIAKTKSNSRSKPTIKVIWKIKQNTKRTKNQTQRGLQSKLSKSIKISKTKNLLQLKNKPDNEELQSTIDAATSSAIQD